MAKLSRTPYPVPSSTFPNTPEAWEEYWLAEDHVFKKLQQESDSLPDGVLYDPSRAVGYLLAFPVADGHAYYRVINDCPLTLQHIPLGDAYQIDLDRVLDMSLRSVRNHQKRERAFQALWKEKEHV